MTDEKELDLKNAFELEAAKIAMMMHPDRDYNMSFRREGTELIMTIVEQKDGNLPAERFPTSNKSEMIEAGADVIAFLKDIYDEADHIEGTEALQREEVSIKNARNIKRWAKEAIEKLEEL